MSKSLKKNNFLYLFASLFLLAPNIAWAINLNWTPIENDRSVYYLGQIFGNMGTVLTGTANGLIGSLFYIFNIAVLSIGSIVVSYTVILTSINTAQEGEVMGRKWSSVWIPLRSAVGMAVLLPTASGYSLIQILMMKFILMGIGAADQVWNVVYSGITSGTAMGEVKIPPSNLRSASQSLLRSLVCAQVFNNDPICKIAINNKSIIPYIYNDEHYYVGATGDSNYQNLCGGLTRGAVPNNVSPDTWVGANISAFQGAVQTLSGAAAAIYTADDPSHLNGIDFISAASDMLKGTLSIVTANPTSEEDKENNGWIFAGSYYFLLVNAKGNVSYPSPATSAGDTSSVGTECSTILNNYLARVNDFISSGSDNTSNTSSTNDQLQLTRPELDSASGGPLYTAIADAVQGLAWDIINALTNNDDDPIVSLRDIGSTIMTTVENLWFTVMIVGFALLIVGCIFSGLNPLCWALGMLMTFLVPILTIIITLLWTAGATIGLYLPLVPYLVYTFTALGWLLLVIETIAAAPIVALGLASPAAEILGKASPAVMLITNVFLRPSLMVIGFVTAVKLVRAAIDMVNFGFKATITASVTALGIFGAIALICLYGGLCIAVVHECFSLVYILPDKIVRWIGGSAERSSVKEQLQEVRSATEKGAEMGAGMMKSSAGAIEQKVQKQMDEGGQGMLTEGIGKIKGLGK